MTDLKKKFEPSISKLYGSCSPNSIVMAFRGSIAHGTYRPNTDENSIDDVDFISICVPGIENYFGCLPSSAWGNRGTKEVRYAEIDLVQYELTKFFSLLIKSNPNIHSLLFLQPEHIVWKNNSWDRIISRRDIFASKLSYQAYCGYAGGQLGKMKAFSFQGYMGEKRKGLVDKFGYDTKNAAHAIRLLRMGVEYLKTGVVRVDRTNFDAEQLVAIKNGMWSIEMVRKEAELLFAEAEEAFRSSSLPEQPDYQAIEKLCVDIIKTELDLYNYS